MQYQQQGSCKTLNAICVLVGLLVLVAITWAQGNGWTTKAEMPTARHSLSTSVVDGMIYAIGGVDDGVLRQVEAYNPAIDIWTAMADLPEERQDLSTSVVNGKIYAIGGTAGRSGASRLSAVEAYDPATDTWIAKADMPTARSHISTSVVNGIIYAIGGTASTSHPFTELSTVEAYAPATDTWTAIVDMPTARNSLSTSVVGDRIYAIGGSQAGKGISVVEVFDPATDTWTAMADMPTAREAVSTGAMNGKIYAIGGREYAGAPSGPLSIVEVYDPATDTWTAIVDMPTARTDPSVSVVGDRIYVIGGSTTDSPFHACSTVEAYDPGSDPGPTSIEALGWGLIKELMQR